MYTHLNTHMLLLFCTEEGQLPLDHLQSVIFEPGDICNTHKSNLYTNHFNVFGNRCKSIYASKCCANTPKIIGKCASTNDLTRYWYVNM